MSKFTVPLFSVGTLAVASGERLQELDAVANLRRARVVGLELEELLVRRDRRLVVLRHLRRLSELEEEERIVAHEQREVLVHARLQPGYALQPCLRGLETLLGQRCDRLGDLVLRQ